MINKILLKKEIRQHGLIFLSIFSLYLVAYLLIHNHVLNESDTRTFEQQLQTFLLLFVPLASFVICDRLVRKEYGAKTQIFLEGLPLTRFKMVFSKYTFGLVLVLTLFFLLAIITIYSSFQHNKMDLRFSTILLTRVFAYCFFWFSFFFVTSFLGRYRLAFYIIILFAMMMLSTLTVFEFKRFAPFVLMDSTFAFERINFPLKEIWTTLILSSIFSSIAFVLAMVKEGSLATLISEKMTHREKVFISITILVFIFSIAYLEAKKEKSLIEIENDISISEFGIEVNILLADSSSKESGEALCRKLHSDIKQLKEYLNITNTLPVNIVERLDLDSDKYEQGSSSSTDGIVLRTNFTHPEWNQARLFEAVYHSLISEYTKKWVLHERCHWVLDGFSLYWSARNDSSIINKLWLRSLVGIRDKSVYDDLLVWDTVEKSIGIDVASGVAWSALVILKDNFGEEKFKEFVKKVFNPNLPKDFRILWQGNGSYSDVALQSVYNLNMDELKKLWIEKMEEKGKLFSEELQKIPEINFDVVLEDLSKKSKILKYQISLDNYANQKDVWVKFKYGKLYRFAVTKSESNLKQDIHRYKENYTTELQESFEVGTRIYCGAEIYIDAIGCYLNSGWQIVEVY